MTDDVPFAKLFTILRRRRGIVFLFALVGAVAATTLGALMPPPLRREGTSRRAVPADGRQLVILILILGQ
jgi:hypothetical protein